MRVQRLGWLGTRTEQFEATRTFFTDVLGLAVEYEEQDFALIAFPAADHDYVEVIGPTAEDSEFERRYYTSGPVVGFVVDDIVAARAELAARGVELLGDIAWSRWTPGYGWFHLRGPDGNVYGMLQGTRLIERDSGAEPTSSAPRDPNKSSALPA
jgi:catechol 2,3-dioxygenase-like lactoylglutathione lyase family enzyme